MRGIPEVKVTGHQNILKMCTNCNVVSARGGRTQTTALNRLREQTPTLAKVKSLLSKEQKLDPLLKTILRPLLKEILMPPIEQQKLIAELAEEFKNSDSDFQNNPDNPMAQEMRSLRSQREQARPRHVQIRAEFTRWESTGYNYSAFEGEVTYPAEYGNLGNKKEFNRLSKTLIEKQRELEVLRTTYFRQFQERVTATISQRKQTAPNGQSYEALVVNELHHGSRYLREQILPLFPTNPFIPILKEYIFQKSNNYDKKETPSCLGKPKYLPVDQIEYICVKLVQLGNKLNPNGPLVDNPLFYLGIDDIATFVSETIAK